MPLTVAQLVARLTADTSGFYRGMAIANSSMLRTGGLITRVAAGAGLATLGMGLLSLRAAGNFQESMNILQAVSGATTGQMKALRGESIKLGADMKLPNVSAKDAAQAMQELAKGGLSVKDILSATRGTLQLGLAANIGFADSATVVARALQAFGLSGSHATEVADLFTAAANKSTADMTDVALGFQQASAQFKAGDQTIQGLTTSLALMANAGIVGSDAGTSLKTMMNRLMAPTKKSSKLMEKLGIDVYDSAGNMKQMPDIIRTFTKGLTGMSKEQKNAALYTIFGSDAIRASRVMLNAGADGWLNMEKKITKGGEAQKFAEARTKGFNGALQAFGSTIETLAIILGEAMLPAAEAAVRGMANFVASIDPLKIIAFFTAIKNLIVAMFNFVKGSDAAQYAIAAIVGALVGLKVVSSIIGMVRALQAAWLVLNASFVASPLGLLVLGLAALAGALVLAYMKSETFRNIVNRAFTWIEANVVPLMKRVAKYIINNWDTVVSTTKRALAIMVSVVRTGVAIIRQLWAKFGGDIMRIVSVAFGIMSTLVRTQLANLRSFFRIFSAVLKGDWGKAWDEVKAIVQRTLTAAASIVKRILTQLAPAVLALAFKIAISIQMGIVKGLARLFVAVWTKILGALRSAISAAAAWAGAAAAGIGAAIAHGVAAGILNNAGGIAGGIIGVVKKGIEAGRAAAGAKSPSTVSRDLIGKPIAQGIILGFLIGSADLPKKISDRLKAALERGRAAVEAYRERFKMLFDRIASDALSAFDAITQAHQTPTEQLIASAEAVRRMDQMNQELAAARAEYNRVLADPEATAADRASALERISQAEWEIRKAGLEKVAETERLEYDSQRALLRRHLEDRLNALLQQAEKEPQKHKNIQKKILALLGTYGIDYQSSGRVLGQAFATGLRESMTDIRKAIIAIGHLIAKYLKLKSPAARGPLADLDRWWDGFASTLVSGLDTGALTRAAASAAGVGMQVPGTAYAGLRAPAATSQGATIIETTYNIPNYLGDKRELESWLKNSNASYERSNNRTLLGGR